MNPDLHLPMFYTRMKPVQKKRKVNIVNNTGGFRYKNIPSDLADFKTEAILHFAISSVFISMPYRSQYTLPAGSSVTVIELSALVSINFNLLIYFQLHLQLQ